MNKAVRTSLRLVVSIVLLSAVALAHVTGSNVDKNTNRGHHSRLSKLAFWRGHKDHNRSGAQVAKVHQNKNGERRVHLSKLAFWRHHKDSDTNAKAAQASHASPNPTAVKTAQTKPAPHTPAAARNGQKQGLHATRKVPAKTKSATKAKPKQTAESRTTASLKQ